MKEAETARSNLAQDLGRLRLELEKVLQAVCADTYRQMEPCSVHIRARLCTYVHFSARSFVSNTGYSHVLHLSEYCGLSYLLIGGVALLVRAIHRCKLMQVSSERDACNDANTSLKAELERYRDVTGSTADALEREKAVKAQLETHNKAQVRCAHPIRACAAHAVRLQPEDTCFWL